eukprot:gene30640-35655_t
MPARLHLLLLLVAAFPSTFPLVACASQGEKDLKQRYPLHSWVTNVEKNYSTGQGHDPSIYEHIFDDNLEVDLAPWRRRKKNLTASELLEQSKGMKSATTRRLIAIRGRQVYLPLLPPGSRLATQCDRPCDEVFSLHKQWSVERDEDILVPVTLDANQPSYDFPWEKKIDRAFFRGTNYCHSRTFGYAKDVCSRKHLEQLSRQASARGPAILDSGAPMLDVGLTAKLAGNIGKPAPGSNDGLILQSTVPIESHARFSFLLSLDGITASNRLSKLMHTNSVVLKQHSPWIEWYYRSLAQGVHYIGFWETHR